MQQYQNVTIERAQKLIGSTSCTVFDIRDDRSYEQGRLPGAIRINDKLLRRMRKTEQRNQPVIVYCYHGNSSKDVAQLLCDFGFTDVYNLDGGYTAWESLHKNSLPSQNSHPSLPDVIQLWMLDHGFDSKNINARLEHGVTALMLACQYGLSETVTALIDAGANINLTNNDGNNALWLACYSGDSATIELLIDNGVDINNINDTGATALIYASSAGKADVVKQLLDAGANPYIRTQDDFTALDLAASRQTYHLFRKIEPVF